MDSLRPNNILVLCTGNSCRSQIAEGYLRNLTGGKANIFSAGIENHGVNPRAIKVMSEVEIDLSSHTSNHIDEYTNIDFNHIITVCDHAAENCPVISLKAQRHHCNFPDPAKAIGSEEEIMVEFRRVRDMIEFYLKKFVEENC